MEIEDYDFPSDSDIYVEAYRQTRWVRHPLGATGSFNNAAGLPLIEFDEPDDTDEVKSKIEEIIKKHAYG